MDVNVTAYDHILVCPLDWGLGHATRCIPLIDYFLSQDKKVSIAGNGLSLELLRIEYPDIQSFELPAYNISYPKNGSLFPFQMALQSPKVLSAISKEKVRIQDIITSECIDFIISDNRYGCYSDKCKSIFMTHQLNIAFPKGFKWMNKINEKFISKFEEVWVPDLEGSENLSGELSHGGKLENVKFIGPLSRFKKGIDKIEIDILVIISGPEPQRSIFEKLVLEKLKDSDQKCAMVRGLPNSDEALTSRGIDIFNHLNARDLNELILKSARVLCRSGYSSIMDLYTLGKGATIIPTPGQTEQEYLAKYLDDKFGFNSIDQKELERLELSNLFSDILSH